MAQIAADAKALDALCAAELSYSHSPRPSPMARKVIPIFIS
jgi:hypothetical protein